MKFTDRVVWITGASSGIGKATALAFSEQGTRLILSSRNESKLQEVKNLCKKPDSIEILPLDLDNYHDLLPIVEKAIALFGTVDILINNGGISQRSLVIDTELNVDSQIFKTNYFGTVALTKALLPYFLKKKSGHFVVITSVVGKLGTPLRSSYAASKHALHGFFDSLRAEIHKDNIAVSLICPGFINTEISKNALTGDGSKQNTLDKATANGLSPTYFAKRLLKVISRKKSEKVIGGKLEILAVYMKRFFPSILATMIRKLDVT